MYIQITETSGNKARVNVSRFLYAERLGPDAWRIEFKNAIMKSNDWYHVTESEYQRVMQALSQAN
jgi:hypothetical protein